ncbi:MAG TPA: M57 family metalloprotease [Flavisolibacter sp.]
MKRMIRPFAIAFCATVVLVSCKKDTAPQEDQISEDVLTQIYNHGFGKTNVQKVDEGYLVEGDIILTTEFLNSTPGGNFLRIANNEQYRTTNLVNAGGGRVITVSMDPKLKAKAGYTQALQEMVNRYNAQNLLLSFQVVASGGTINFVDAGGPYLASAGFPSGGNPYPQVKVYSRNVGEGTTTTFINYAATIFAHEVGHCIGFRHTDYMDRSYSCGGAYSNEGASSVGAVHIPGTPTTADAGSWMLACIGRNQNRYFNPNDQTALGYLY